MKVAYIAAGAAGMYCGSCIHDNTLATALLRLGVDLALLPTYTPLRTDEADVSLDRVFYGGINVYLQQKSSFFRRLPRALGWILDRPGLLQGLSRLNASTDARDLGQLTVSVLAGEEGHQSRELQKLVAWLKNDFRPDLVHLTNSMFVGLARRLKAELQVPVLCAVQGEDLFLDGLIAPYKAQARDLLRRRAADVDAFVAPNRYYAGHMSAYIDMPAEKMHVVPLGLNPLEIRAAQARPAQTPLTIGYLARVCPEKGFHLLVDAFRLVAEAMGPEQVCLKAAGYMAAKDKAYFAGECRRLESWGLADRFTYVGEVDRQGKFEFLRGLDLFSVPTLYREAKGLSVLEALASGVPVVQPGHGAFTEMIEQTGGGILVEPESAEKLAAGMLELLRDGPRRAALSASGQAQVRQRFTADAAAGKLLRVFERYAGE
jgi:glycosyltransferase involved in cell wall biosynthesis